MGWSWEGRAPTDFLPVDSLSRIISLVNEVPVEGQVLMDRVLWLTPQAPDPEHQRPEEDFSKHLVPLKIAGWDLHPERARAEGLHSSSLRLKQRTDLNVSGAAFKEIGIRKRNEECEAIRLVVSLMLLHLIFANLIFTHASLTKIMLQGTASVLLIINNQPKIHGMYSRGLQLGSYITS